MRRRMTERIALVAFPASAIVIITAAIIEGVSSVDVSNEVAAAATGLLTFLSYVVLGAGEKA